MIPPTRKGPEDLTSSEAQYAKRALAVAQDQLFDPENDVHRRILEVLSAPGDLAQKVGQLAAELVMQQQNLAQSVDREIPESILQGLGEEIIGQILEVGIAEGVVPEMEEQELQAVMGKALKHGIDFYRQQREPEGRWDQEMYEQSVAEYAQREMEAQQSGTVPPQGGTALPQGGPPQGGDHGLV